MKRRHAAYRQQGLSLIELMIAITLGLLVLAALLTLFVQNNRSFRQNDALAEMQDSARFGLEALARDLSMAGFYGGMYGSSGIVPWTVAPTVDCGALDYSTSPATPWAFKLAQRVEFWNHTGTSGTVASAFPCLNQSTTPVATNTDVVAIRRVAGQATATVPSGNTAKAKAYNFYLKTNGTAGSIFQNGSSDTITLSANPYQPLQAPVTFYKYVPRVYFIRTYSQTAGDGIPTLCRMELQQASGATMAVECLADGVENLQIEWGLDLDTDCSVDTYSSSPTAAQLAQSAITARIWLLVRTTQKDGGFDDQKSFSFADYAGSGLDVGYHRRVYSTTVQLRNPIAENGPCASVPPPAATR